METLNAKVKKKSINTAIRMSPESLIFLKTTKKLTGMYYSEIVDAALAHYRKKHEEENKQLIRAEAFLEMETKKLIVAQERVDKLRKKYRKHPKN